MVTKNILLLDEHPELYNLISEKMGEIYNINWVENKEEWEDAQEKLDKTDLLILDPVFTVVSSREILKALKGIGHVIPILMILSKNRTPEPLPPIWKKRVFDYISPELPPFLIIKRIENSIEFTLAKKTDQQIKTELNMAQQIQECMLPSNIEENELIKVICWTKPIQIIGGDIYEYLLFRDKRLMFYIADVMTHGVSAALISMSLKILFSNAIKISDDPGKILSIINYELGRILPHEFFITLFCGIINPKAKTLIYANAGHSLPLCCQKGTIIALENSLPSLGPVKSFKYKSSTMPFEPGNKMLLYTDGVIERLNIEDKFTNNQHLYRLMKENSSTRDLYKALINALTFNREYQLKDDCSFIIIEYKEGQ